MILPATEILYQWSLHAVNGSKWRKKREAHVLLVGRWESRIASLWSQSKHKPTHLQRHSGITSMPVTNIQAWF